MSSERSERDGGGVSAGPLAGLSVLVVDDHADTREMVRELLGDAGAYVIDVDSGWAALDSLRVVRPHVMVSDILMPEMNGYDLIRRVLLTFPDLPALAMSCVLRPEDRTRALANGFRKTLVKPLDPTELVAAVAHLAHRPAR